MGKKRNQNKAKKPVQQKSFQQTVAEAVNTKLMDTIDQKINMVGMQLLREQQNSLGDIYSRLMALESLCLEKFKLTEEEFAMLVAEAEDKAYGLETGDVVETGDLVRLTISTKASDQDEYAGTTKRKIENIGSGSTFGSEIESNILQMKVGETKEFKFGENECMTAKVLIERTSRRPKPELTESSDETADA